MSNEDREGDADHSRKASPYDGLSKWQSEREDYELHECLNCRERHKYTRKYSLVSICFLLFIIVFRWKYYFYCPRCMRKHIALFLVPNMLLATILAPVVLILWTWTFCRTFSRVPYDRDRDR